MSPKTLCLLVTISLFAALPLCSQVNNLVPNPGFEEYYRIPPMLSASHQHFLQYVRFWSTPNTGTADLLCDQTNTQQWITLIPPHSGKFMAGIYSEKKAYCEYLKVELKEDLEPGVPYYAQFSFATAPQSFFMPTGNIRLNNRFGMWADANYFFDNASMINRQPQVFGDTALLVKPGTWHSISGTFTVKKPCSNLYIGQFQTDPDKFVPFYCFIDDVILCPASDTQYLKTYRPISLNTAITLPEILFETGKSALLPAAGPGLDRLAEIMQTDRKLRLEIAGHTDNEGDAQRNLALSEERAQSVFHYLVGKGVEKDRMVCKGYGATRPVAGNQTTDGRQQNRRVEFLLIK